MGEGKMTSSSIATCKESWPQGHESGRTGPVPPPAPTAARRKTNPVPRLCRTLELTLLAGVQVRKPWGHESRNTGPVPCCLLQLGKLASHFSAEELALVMVMMEKGKQAGCQPSCRLGPEPGL